MNELLSRIVPLDKARWAGYPIYFNYTTNSYLDLQIVQDGCNFRAELIKKPFDSPRVHIQQEKSALYEPWWDSPQAWGIVVGDRLIALMESTAELWNNRLRVTQLWIDDAYHRRGIGTALMNIAVERARDEKRRAVALETQSCNETAIAFYLSYGFTLIGFDTISYNNDDVARREVRIELGLTLPI